MKIRYKGCTAEQYMETVKVHRDDPPASKYYTVFKKLGVHELRIYINKFLKEKEND